MTAPRVRPAEGVTFYHALLQFMSGEGGRIVASAAAAFDWQLPVISAFPTHKKEIIVALAKTGEKERKREGAE